MTISPKPSNRMSAAEFRSRDKVKKPSKYGNRRAQSSDGKWFDSIKERNRYEELLTLEKQGIISHLECQPKFPFVVDGRKVVSRSERYPNGRQLSWTGDFAYFDGKHRVVEDAKGFRTKEFILKKAFVEALYPGTRIVEV